MTKTPHLEIYVNNINFWLKISKRELYDVKNLTVGQKKDILDRIENDLSPENLTCDGELSGAALKAKVTLLNEARKELRQLK